MQERADGPIAHPELPGSVLPERVEEGARVEEVGEVERLAGQEGSGARRRVPLLDGHRARDDRAEVVGGRLGALPCSVPVAGDLEGAREQGKEVGKESKNRMQEGREGSARTRTRAHTHTHTHTHTHARTPPLFLSPHLVSQQRHSEALHRAAECLRALEHPAEGAQPRVNHAHQPGPRGALLRGTRGREAEGEREGREDEKEDERRGDCMRVMR
jgi:hypothetical protein